MWIFMVEWPFSEAETEEEAMKARFKVVYGPPEWPSYSEWLVPRVV
jgi:hypothetical protein